jgi:hypothetical protein
MSLGAIHRLLSHKTNSSASSSSSSSSVKSWALTDLFRLRLISSSRVFQVVFDYLVYNSAFVLASCCCSFYLHVVGNLICIFLVSRHLVSLSAFPNFFIPFVVKKGVLRCSSEKMSSRLMLVAFYPFFFRGPKFLFHI